MEVQSNRILKYNAPSVYVRVFNPCLGHFLVLWSIDFYSLAINVTLQITQDRSQQGLITQCKSWNITLISHCGFE